MFVRAGLPEPAPNQADLRLVEPRSPPRVRRPRLGVRPSETAARFASSASTKEPSSIPGRSRRLTTMHGAFVSRTTAGSSSRSGRPTWRRAEARWDTIRRFAEELDVPESALTLHDTDPHFFSRHAIDAAIARDDRWRARRAAELDGARELRTRLGAGVTAYELAVGKLGTRWDWARRELGNDGTSEVGTRRDRRRELGTRCVGKWALDVVGQASRGGGGEGREGLGEALLRAASRGRRRPGRCRRRGRPCRC